MAKGSLLARIERIENEIGRNTQLKVIVAYSNENGTYTVDDEVMTRTQLDQHQKKYEEVHGFENIFTIIF